MSSSSEKQAPYAPPYPQQQPYAPQPYAPQQQPYAPQPYAPQQQPYAPMYIEPQNSKISPQAMIVESQNVYVPQPAMQPMMQPMMQPNYYQIGASSQPAIIIGENPPAYQYKQDIHRSPFPRGWNSPFCGCYDAPGTFCLASCCPCIQYAENKVQLGETEDCGKDCLSYLCSMAFLRCCCVPAFMGSRARKTIRNKFNIEGEDFWDFCAHAMCWSCALTQEHMEIARTMRPQQPN